MKLSSLKEPELEFGNGNTHIDIRFGLMCHGPLDIGDTTAPTQLKVGIVGTEETVSALRAWLDKCRAEIPAKSSKQPNLFPKFPGFSADSCFGASLLFNDRWCSAIKKREIETAIAHGTTEERVSQTVDLFVSHAQSVVEQGGPSVLLCVPPQDLLAAVDERTGDKPDALDQELDEGSEPAGDWRPPARCFHDVLKAEGMRITLPLQMVRPQTYGQPVAKRGRRRTMPLQDEATRAWNLHMALYYKAGGIPWRLLRRPSDLSTCFVGISFFKTTDGMKVLTSVAQVFNERGEGIIVKGAPAQLDKDDRQPHLSDSDARQLLKNAIDVYRREHKTSPARIVLHKTSHMTNGEIAGFQAAADEQRIDNLELVSIRRSFTRLFREGSYPPLRGTFLELQQNSGLIYLRGSVNFFETYPGMYVPRPIELTVAKAESSPIQLAAEMLSLSKLNWNNTQFDGGEPITVRAARRVGDILKCIPDGLDPQPGFRFFM